MSKFILYDWRCNTASCYTKFEDLAKPDVLVGTCPECGGQAKRLISTPRLDPKMGLDPDMGTMYDKWAKKKEQQYKINKQKEADHGEDW